MASFAKSQLLKYGWTEGKGLGKNENGIVDALKPKLKFDTTGVGHNTKEHKWWESVYDKAANNVEIDTRAKEVSVKIKDSDAFDITTSKYDTNRLKKTHNLQYGSFLKTCTLDNGKIVPDDNSARSALNDIVHETTALELSDEQLFKACGGRTAHKGARHGLNLNGKLARIAQQEAELLGQKPQRSLSESTDIQESEKKSKRKRRLSAAEMDVDSLTTENSRQTDTNANTLARDESSAARVRTEYIRKMGRISKRKEKRRLRDLVHQLDSVALDENSAKAENDAKNRKLKKLRKIVTEPIPVARKDERLCTETKNCDNEETNENKNPRILPKEKTIELADGNVITLDDEEERDAKPTKKRKVELTDADRLNNRIARRKTKYLAKVQRKRVDRLSECLMAVNLCEDSVDSGRGEDLVESWKAAKKLKKWKKHKKEKKEKKSEEIITVVDP